MIYPNLIQRFVAFCILAIMLSLSYFASAMEIVVGAVEVSQRGYWGKDGKAKGSSVEITNSVVEKSGYTAINKIMPYPRLLHNLEAGTVDAALLVPNDKVTRVATPLIHLQNVDFIIVGKNDLEVNELADIEGLRVGYLRSSRISERILESLDVVRVEGDKYTHMINMLMHGRIDALVAAKYTLNYSLKELGFNWQDLSSPLLVRQLELHLVYSKRNTNKKVMASLVEAAIQLKSEGVIQEIIERYDPSL